MLFKNKMLIFFPSLMVGTFMTISSSSWFTAWMGLEINLMSMTPIIINKLNFLTIEASIKYFLVQAISSSLLIFFSILSYNNQEWNLAFNLENMYFLSLSLKAGIPPLHFWFPQVILCADWAQSIILLTWQKIAPFILLSYLQSQLVVMFIITSSIVGMMGGINQIDIKLILVYSSIMNSAWMLSLTSNNEVSWWMYFISYTLITISTSYIFVKFGLKKMSSLHKLSLPIFSKISFLINFLSLAGLPPFLGFFIKILAINLLMENNLSLMIIFILVISSIFSFYFYLRTSYSTLFINENSLFVKIMNEDIKSFKIIYLINILSTLGILITPMLMILI